MNQATAGQPQTRQPSISPPHTMIIACEHRVVSELNNVAQRFTVDAREVHYFMEQWSRTSMIHDPQVHAALTLRDSDGCLMLVSGLLRSFQRTTFDWRK